ncbi:MAG: hypothetical protein H0V44_02965 [Planctomycetes bacterium]|nr:hypothetical protein [Planctomycetota bacterium]
MPALADLVAHAAQKSQVLVTTHAVALADAIAARLGAQPIRLELTRDGDTVISGGVGSSGLRRIASPLRRIASPKGR